ncbi:MULTISPECIES: hypothetical protein [Pacificibacter]|uniref:hypothetical protein n=1 Tax=Pacificibacter TaxID=1042323 RepID=UPI001C08AD92|nr:MULTISPECIES: hypothetical protein [Pacificibacter]MBU2936186.1 hypothetical protein [Pacificibacter marinus]MDO6616821.1 hypothetical protein [Pacificibacter sp. 1_MG-2023]
MANGVGTNNLDSVTLCDEVLVNKDGSTARQKVSDLAAQVAGSDAFAEQITPLQDRAAVLEATSSDQGTRLSVLEDGTYAEAIPYATSAAGIANTSEGQRFKVDNADPNVAYDVYLHDTGSVAVFVESQPSVAALTSKADQSALEQEAVDRATADDLKLDKTVRSALSFHCAVGGTDNAITLTNTDVPNLVAGLSLRFTATATNTTAGVTIQVNGGGTYNLKLQTGGNPGVGAIKSGWTYDLVWSGAPSNAFKLLNIADQYISKANNSSLIPSVVGGTANAIEVTTDFARVNGSILIFRAAETNTITSPTLNVNGIGASTIRHADGGLLAAGDIEQGRLHLVRYDASGGNPWVLLASGITLGDLKEIADGVAALDTRLTIVEANSGSSGAFETEAMELMEKINGPSSGDADWATSERNPNNFFTWSEGIRTQDAPLELKILGLGSSIDTGAGADDGGASAPSRILRDCLNETFGYMRNVEFSAEVNAVGGETVDQFMDQLTNTTAGDYDLIVGFNNMNSGGISSSSGAATMESVYDDYIELIAAIRGVDRNAMPIITNTFHPHTDFLSGGGDPQQFPDGYKSSWPTSNTTYSATHTHTFDAAAGTIALLAINTYGYTFAIGDELTVFSGDAAGVYTIASIDWATGVVTVNETISYTGTYSVKIQNTTVDEERVIWPANSERLVKMDRTGSGVKHYGWRTYDEQNFRIGQACTDAGAMLWDLQAMQYRYYDLAWASGNFTEATLPNSMFRADATIDGDGTGLIQHNHPNAAFYKFAYGALAAQFALHVRDGTLHKNRVLG